MRQQLARLHTLGRLFDLTNARVRTALSSGSIPGVEGSILKLALAQLGTAVAELMLKRLPGAAASPEEAERIVITTQMVLRESCAPLAPAPARLASKPRATRKAT